MRKATTTCLALALALLFVGSASALTIYDVQFSTGPDYDSPYVGQTVTVTGGIITKVFVGGRTKLTIQDPTLGDAWAGVQVIFDDSAMAAGLVRGDQIDLVDVVVDEYRGNTQIWVEVTSTVVLNSSGHTVDPLVVTPADIGYPPDHAVTEPYEFMLLELEGVTVGTMGLGSHADNYELFDGAGTCWASDYANYDLPPGSDYYVTPGAYYDGIVGYLEQYTKLEDGWDCYQLLPRDAGDYENGSVGVESLSWAGVKALYR
jgi:hypothetical protein